jgi:exosortase
MAVTTTTTDTLNAHWIGWAKAHWVAIAAFALLLAPTIVALAYDVWPTETGSHSIFIMAVALWLIYQRGEAMAAAASRPSTMLGAFLLVCGLAALVLGRSQGVLIAEAGSQVITAVGLIVLFAGLGPVRVIAFPLVFLIFSMPFPGWLVDVITQPLKIWVSETVVWLLALLNYPVAKDGIIIYLGQYQLLVEDACSGLNSIMTLSALMAFYVYMRPKGHWLEIVLLLASIIPIAVIANVLRVMTLCLITYHMGEEAGQGFLHTTSGLVLFAGAILFIFLVEQVLAQVFRLARLRS